ncbi:MAG: hypothetical protein HOP96_09900 [Sphingomonas sp.]|nr:hypothetical protein [Sphingomonas sp.]
MAFLAGIGIAATVGAFARVTGMDRDKAFYSTVLIVVGHYYILFAAMIGSAVTVEALIFCLFAALAVVGFRFTMWFVAAGLALHGLFDYVRHLFLAGHGAPVWWPDFCMGFDIAAAGVVAGTLIVQRRKPEEVLQ